MESRSTLTGMDLNDLTFDWATDEVSGHECDHRSMPVIWGYPTEQDMARADRGEVYIGGCVLGGFTRWCPECQIGFD